MKDGDEIYMVDDDKVLIGEGYVVDRSTYRCTFGGKYKGTELWSSDARGTWPAVGTLDEIMVHERIGYIRFLEILIEVGRKHRGD